MKLRLAILSRDNWQCRYCGGWADEVDHVIRLEDGGSDDPDNLAAACHACNAAKELARTRTGQRVRFFSDDAPETRPVSAKYLPEFVGISPITGDYSRKR